jgi:8-oxo-dGTP diphosphatase
MDRPHRPMGKPVIKVVAAVIERNGRILVGQRRRSDSHGLKWEFPGGKVERGEKPSAALARELEEELGIQARVGSEIIRYFHEYPKRATILLMFFRVSEFIGEPQSLAFESIVWESPEKLPQYDFLDGDVDFVRRLASGEYKKSI